jgi:hypothetical protein
MRFGSGLLPNPGGSPYFPTFLAHLYGDAEVTSRAVVPATVCFSLAASAASMPRAVGLAIEATAYSAAAQRTFFLNPRVNASPCMSPVFAVADLAQLRAPMPITLAATVRDAQGSVAAMTRAVQSATLLPGNVFTWDPPFPAVGRAGRLLWGTQLDPRAWITAPLTRRRNRKPRFGAGGCSSTTTRKPTLSGGWAESSPRLLLKRMVRGYNAASP